MKENAVALGQAELTWEKMNSQLSRAPSVVAKVPKEESSTDTEEATRARETKLVTENGPRSEKPVDSRNEAEISDGAPDQASGENDNENIESVDDKQRLDPDEDPTSDTENTELDPPSTDDDDQSEDIPLPPDDDDDQSEDVPLPPDDDDDELQRSPPPPPKAGANLAKNRQRDMDKYKDQIRAKIQKQKAQKKRANNKRK